MRTISFLIISSILFSLQATGQGKKNKELGLMLETGMPLATTSNSVAVGALYRVNKKKNKALRFHALYKSRDNTWLGGTFQLFGDTLHEKTLIQNNKTLFLGGGIEMQRNFYKKVFLYAALDTRIGYSFSTFDEQVTKRVGVTNSYVEITDAKRIPNYNSKGIAMDFLGSIGAKLDLKHIKIGIEMGPVIHTSYITYNTNVPYTIFDLDMEFFAHRVYLTYKL